MHIAPIIISLVACFALTGCGTLAREFGSVPITRNIDDDAVDLNNAHARAINGVITINVLRARDRWPTGYTTLSGVRFTPGRTLEGTLTLDPLLGVNSTPLEGRALAARPLTGTNFAGRGTLENEAQFNVNPFAERDNSQSLYAAEQSEGLFRRYFERGWPPNVVFPLFIDKVENGPDDCEIDGVGLLADRINNPNDVQVRFDFEKEYSARNHPCQIVARSFMDAESLDWEYDPNSDYHCERGICTRLNTNRRTSVRRDFGGPGSYPLPIKENPCDNFENAATGLVESLLTNKTEEGLGNKLSAISSASGRDVIVTPNGIRLCDSLDGTRRFFVRTEIQGTETDPEIVERLFNAYQDVELAEYFASRSGPTDARLFGDDLYIYDNFESQLVSCVNPPPITTKQDMDRCAAIRRTITSVAEYFDVEVRVLNRHNRYIDLPIRQILEDLRRKDCIPNTSCTKHVDIAGCISDQIRSCPTTELLYEILRAEFLAAHAIMPDKCDVRPHLTMLRDLLGLSADFTLEDVCRSKAPAQSSLLTIEQFWLRRFASSRTYMRPFQTVHFRSFDDMVHFVGETLRLKKIDGDAVQEEEIGLCVRRFSDEDARRYERLSNTEKDRRRKPQAGLCATTLFSVGRPGFRKLGNTVGEVTRIGGDLIKGHGVKVSHAGHTWYALPEVDPNQVGYGDVEKDRTGTVLTILSQIYLLSQSSEFLEAPDNILIP
ncbi:MAG: hypothetical protein AAFY34_08245 [Pseudomonadota bacterium]